MQKELNKAEVEQIFKFVEDKGLKFYDVQLEMVDHFATTIEDNWEAYPQNWSFEQKILSTYSEMGDKGFKKIIGEKGKVIMQRANKFAINLLKDSLKIPQLIVTLACLYFLHQGFLRMENPQRLFAIGIAIPYMLIILSAAIAYGFHYWRYRQQILALSCGINFHLMVPNLLMLPVYFIDKTSFPFSSEIYWLFSIMIFVQIIYCTGLLLVVRRIFLETKHRYGKRIHA
ncbi:MAG: hypothetical protein AB8G86_21775 [Saprospiraceae bacterium]